MEEKDFKSMTDEEVERIHEFFRLFNMLQDDEKEFEMWVAVGAADGRFEIKDGVQKLLGMYGQATGVSLDRLKK